MTTYPVADLEFTEICETRDEHFVDRSADWGTRIRPPSGPGWLILNGSRERHTTWMRRHRIARDLDQRRRS